MSSTKKIFPFNIIIVLAIFLAGTLYVNDHNYLSAKKSKVEKKKFQHYENMLIRSDLTTDQGKKFSGKELTQGVVILNFWASWCKPCLEEFPSVVEFRSKFDKEKVKIIAINSDEDNVLKNVKKTKKKYKLNFDIVLDKNAKITDNFMISAIPVSIIYNNGKVVEVSNGSKDFMAEEFLEQIKGYIK